MIRLVWVVGMLASLLTWSCSTPPPLANAKGSPEAVASAVLDALARQDRAALEGLALNEQEFKDHVWPDLPASRSERNLPFSYVWGDLHQKSLAALAGTLRTHAGQRYTLESVSFDGETLYATYLVRRKATFRVRDALGGEHDIRACGSMIEKDGTWKVFSYVADAD